MTFLTTFSASANFTALYVDVGKDWMSLSSREFTLKICESDSIVSPCEPKSATRLSPWLSLTVVSSGD